MKKTKVNKHVKEVNNLIGFDDMTDAQFLEMARSSIAILFITKESDEIQVNIVRKLSDFII